METQAPGTEQKISITRRFKAPREKVFAAWTTPEVLKQWLGLECGIPQQVDIDLRTGGAYRIQWKKDGKLSEVSGVYREVHSPERLSFTWEDKELGTGETLVILEFHDRRGSTELVLTHQGFPNSEIREAHNFGWTTSCDALAKIIE